MPLIYLYLITVPVIIILIYLYVRDKFNKEPIWLLLLTYVGGCLSVLPVLFVGDFTEILVPHLRGIAKPLYTAFIQAGFVEEFFKFVIVLLIVWWSKHFDEKFDGIIYSVYVSMGFALVENFLYVTGYGLGTGLMRFFTAVPAHGIFAIAMGYYIGLAKFTPNKRVLYLLMAFVSAWLIHGVYDAILMVGYDWLLFVFFPFLIGMYIFGFRKINRLAKLKVDPRVVAQNSVVHPEGPSDIIETHAEMPDEGTNFDRDEPARFERNGTKE